MENKNRFYVLNGVVYPLEDTKPSEYIIGSAADLATLTGVIFPGSIARIAGTKNWYEMKPNGEWSEAHNEENDDFAPDISNPQDGDTLVYDGTAGKWVNGAASGGMVVPVLTTADHGATWTCSHTYAEIAALITAGKCNQIKTVEEGVTVYETLVDIDYPRITFHDVAIDENGVCSTEYIITPDGISVVEAQYPQNPQNP